MTLGLSTRNQFETSRFGVIEPDPELIITLEDGMIGFENCHRFVVLHQDETSPLKWLQSLDNGAVAFPIIDPWFFRPDYSPTLSDVDAAELELTEETPKLVFAIVTIPNGNPQGMTANLLGPIIVNPLSRRGKQVIVTDEEYGTKHIILEEMARIGLR